MHEMIREIFVLILEVIRRRWLHLVIPIALVVGGGIVLLKVSPKKYTTKSLVLIQSANRSIAAAGQNSFAAREVALQQVAAIDAWIKSDHVLKGLLPQFVDGYQQGSPDDDLIHMRVLRQSLTLELVGSSALEFTLDGREAAGLGRKLELVLARIMEGLTGPEQSILNANEFVTIRRSEDVQLADEALNAAIRRLGYQDVDVVKAALHRISESEASGAGAAAAAGGDQQVEAIRIGITTDRKALLELEALFANYRQASIRADNLRGAGRGTKNYVGIFDSPENLLIVGRPQDPIYGESSIKKIVVGLILLTVMITVGIIVALELLSGRVRFRSEFEALTGVPVLARFSSLAS